MHHCTKIKHQLTKNTQEFYIKTFILLVFFFNFSLLSSFAAAYSNSDSKSSSDNSFLFLGFQEMRATDFDSSAGEDPVKSYYGQDLYLFLNPGPNLAQDIQRIIQKNHRPLSYTEARRVLFGQIHLKQIGNQYAVHDVYCNKDYTQSDFRGGQGPGPNQIPDNKILNIEHTWPQSQFSNRYPPDIQKTDMHHLYPSDSEMNSARSSFPFGIIEKDHSRLKCPISHLGSSQYLNGSMAFEPPANHKGNVARALFYFSLRYSISIPGDEERILRQWDKEDPIDQEEFLRNNQIQSHQGNRNPFVDFKNLGDNISGF